MITLAKYHVCNHCINGEKPFQNILIGLGKLPGLSRNGPLVSSCSALHEYVEEYGGPSGKYVSILLYLTCSHVNV